MIRGCTIFLFHAWLNSVLIPYNATCRNATLGIRRFTTLQELNLQSIKICHVVVFSRYSSAKCFANDVSFFGLQEKYLYSSVVERWSCNPKNTGANPSGGNHSEHVNNSSVIFSGNMHLMEISFNGFKFFAILAVANFPIPMISIVL